MNKSWSAIGVASALALLMSIPLGAQTTTTFNLTNVEGESLAGVFTSPYLGYAGPTNPNTPSVPVICDDFSDNSYLPETWTADVTDLSTVLSSSSPLGYLKWNGANSQGVVVPTYAAWDLNQGQAYTAAAILVLDILNLNNAPSAAQQQEDYSYALWELFDPTAAAGTVGGLGNANWGSNNDSVVPWLTTTYPDSVDLDNATQDLETAIATSASALDGYAVTIYSYVAPPPDGNGTTPLCGTPLAPNCASAPPQEFIALTQDGTTTYNNSTPVPEPSSIAVLGAYFLFGGGGLLFWKRRRILGTGN